jgi:hypothetical protein
MGFVLKQVFFGAILPGLVALAAVLASRRPWRREAGGSDALSSVSRPRLAGPDLSGWGEALGLGAGYLAAHAAIKGWPPFPPILAEHKLFALAAGFAVWGILVSATRLPAEARWVVGVFALLAMPWWFLKDLAPAYQPSILTALGWGVAVATLWVSLDVIVEEKSRGACVPLSLGWAAGAAAGFIAWFGNVASFAQFLGALGAGLGACVLVAWWNPRAGLGRGGVAVAVPIWAALVIGGCYHGDAPKGPSLLLLLAPLACLLRIAQPMRSLRPWLATLLTAVLVLALCAGAAGWAWAIQETPDFSGAADLPY